jgi:hypothetical protein
MNTTLEAFYTEVRSCHIDVEKLVTASHEDLKKTLA